ncbi:LysR family transcriptional regulator [Shewanella mangrovi]|uniref:LysR family transcriptional regulator n=1 Tax=Shewanella mangrovi TaxID=1515746 RepID=A0A094JEI2_9GAMM|nr:LysR family transcriptional regulator [Shewanella mangrovi]KFZ37657.1 LysR family transcriptional regulator [Shewanella mangrovi]
MKSSYSLDDLRCFCAVARLGSFKAAAELLAMPLSTLSRRIRQLESDLQLRLLNRDAHRVSLTNTGEQYYQRCAALFEELDDIDEDLHREKHRPCGKVRVSAPINSGSYFLRQIFYDFLQQYPDIQLDLHFSNSLIDIEAEAMDVVFRVGSPIVESWIARPLKDIHFILCAHAQYDVSDIHTPAQLCGHPLVLCRPMIPWQLQHKTSGEAYDYHPQKGVRLEVDEIAMLTHAVKSGLGIGYIPDYFALPMIAEGELVHVLPAWRSQVRTLFMLYRDRDHLPLRVRMLVEYVLQRFAKLD